MRATALAVQETAALDQALRYRRPAYHGKLIPMSSWAASLYMKTLSWHRCWTFMAALQVHGSLPGACLRTLSEKKVQSICIQCLKTRGPISQSSRHFYAC